MHCYSWFPIRADPICLDGVDGRISPERPKSSVRVVRNVVPKWALQARIWAKIGATGADAREKTHFKVTEQVRGAEFRPTRSLERRLLEDILGRASLLASGCSEAPPWIDLHSKFPEPTAPALTSSTHRGSGRLFSAARRNRPALIRHCPTSVELRLTTAHIGPNLAKLWLSAWPMSGQRVADSGQVCPILDRTRPRLDRRQHLFDFEQTHFSPESANIRRGRQIWDRFPRRSACIPSAGIVPAGAPVLTTRCMCWRLLGGNASHWQAGGRRAVRSASRHKAPALAFQELGRPVHRGGSACGTKYYTCIETVAPTTEMRHAQSRRHRFA